jgi:hypothetical protein
MNEIQFLIYEADQSIDVIVQDETVWATQKSIAELFGVNKSSISRHLKNIYESKELEENETVAKFATVVNRGIRGEIEEDLAYYNLDAIISIGYRVNSQKATKFRIWATDVLKEYVQKGFKIDVERMKQGETTFNKDYFYELLLTVRSI